MLTFYPHKYICQKTTSRNQLQSLPVSPNHDENQREPVRPMWFESCFFMLGPDASDRISMSPAISWLPSPSPPLTSIPAFLGPLQLWSRDYPLSSTKGWNIRSKGNSNSLWVGTGRAWSLALTLICWQASKIHVNEEPYMSLLPEAREVTPFGWREPVSYVP